MTESAGPCCPACREDVASSAAYCEACGTYLDSPVTERRTEQDDLRVAAVSDVGLLRGRNEDSFALGVRDHGVVAVVCDGVASSADGRAAADIAAKVTAEVLTEAVDGGDEVTDGEAVMRAAIAAARDAVAALIEGAGGSSAPSCTLVAALWDGHEATIGSVGDSRAYLVTRQRVLQLTVDDSWVQEQVTAGAMSERTALGAPMAHAITNWLGADAPVGERVVVVHPEDSGYLVLCSDGLWNHLQDVDTLTDLVWSGGATPHPIEVARRLTEHSLGDGGSDNVTVAVMEVGP